MGPIDTTARDLEEEFGGAVETPHYTTRTVLISGISLLALGLLATLAMTLVWVLSPALSATRSTGVWTMLAASAVVAACGAVIALVCAVRLRIRTVPPR